MALLLQPTRSTRKANDLVVSKMQQQKAGGGVSLKGGQTLLARIKEIEQVVNLKLAKYIPQYDLFRTEEEAKEVFYAVKHSGEAVLDFETNSLDPISGIVAGAVIYLPGIKPCYIPVNHKSYITNVRYENQVDPRVLAELLQATKDIDWDYHHAKFDTRFAYHSFNVELNIGWDTEVAQHMLNENEKSFSLKNLHLKYCESQDTEALSYESLFEGMPFDVIPMNVGYLYAAGDGIKTWDLKEFQKQYLTQEMLPGPFYVYNNIELPLIKVTAKMEDNGVEVREEYRQELSTKYHKLMGECEAEYKKELSKYSKQIKAWVTKNQGTKEARLLETGYVNPSSPTQLAILLYDILECRSVDKKKPRGTGEDILEKLNLPICASILKGRGVKKLLSTYIENIPALVNPVTGKIHASFRQNGTKTGRYSSADPNMQNIPSKNHDIRKMYTAGEGYVFISSDYSQQEPRLLAFVSKDEQFRKAYVLGRDLYAECASKIFNVPYEECMELFPDGSENPEGAKRRYFCKSVILGLMYGRGAAAIAEQCDISTKEAQRIIDDFYAGFPGVRAWMFDLVETARETGYVETIMGRKRRLPDLQLADYEFRYTKEKKQEYFDPLDFTNPDDIEVEREIIESYLDKLSKAYGRQQKSAIVRTAREAGIIIKDNGGFIADAERQAVNSVIQGSAADMTKVCMLRLHHDKKFNALGGTICLQVHDELICRGPRENAKQLAERISKIMVEVAEEMVPIEMKWKCDTTITQVWYGEELEVA